MPWGGLMRGLFIAFEGIDGCGKSTQLDRAARTLEREGFSIITTREPGGTAIAEKIRALLIAPEHREMHNECELLLYAAARAQHVREKIAPALERGVTVLCDRFHLATFAYQGFGRAIPLGLLTTINDFAAGGVLPDVSFVFDISVEKAFARLSAMNKARDRLELGGEEFFSRIAEGYRSLAKADPQRTILLHGDQSVDVLAGEVYTRIRAAMAARDSVRR
jgi:dTMP kinase